MYFLTFIGLYLELAGAFLLSVEAIGAEHLNSIEKRCLTFNQYEMRKKTVIVYQIILLLFIISTVCWSQDYFPLQVGNAWYLSSIPEYIEQVVTLDSLKYYKTLHSTYYRKDSLDRVFIRTTDGEEWLKYDFQAQVGQSWVYGSSYKFRAVLESKTETLVLPIGTFYSCYKFSYYGINVFDADYSVWFAPGVGTVKSKSISWGGESELLKAIVNGKKIPDFPVPLKIIQTIPSSNQIDVPTDAPVIIHFNFAIKIELINADNIKVFSNKHGPVAGTFTNINKFSSNRITFTPELPFSPNDVITVIISSKIEDYTGDFLSQDYLFSFAIKKEEAEPTLFARDTLSAFTPLESGDFDWGDYDNDGDNDLILFGTIDSVDVGLFHHIELYENHSNLFLKKETNFTVISPHFGYGKGCIKWTDYNNDSKLDLVYAGRDSARNSVTLFYQNKNGIFELDNNNRLNFGYASMDWCDYNSDGFSDLAIWGYSKTASTSYAAIYKNENGKLINQNVADIPYEDSGIIKWIDFNNDGAMDIITVSHDQLKDVQFYGNQNNQFFKQEIDVSYQNWLPYHFGFDDSDMELDGDIDILIGGFLLIRQGNSYLLDENRLEYLSDAFGRFIDFDNDRDEDLFIVGNKKDAVQRERTYIQIYQNINGQLFLFKEIGFNRNIHLYSSKWIDLNDDGRIDLTMMTNEGFLIYYNLLNIALVESQKNNAGKNYELIRAYPNPFNSEITIQYFVPENGKIVMSVLNVQGQLVRTLINGFRLPGSFQLSWDGSDNDKIKVASGLYIINLYMNQYCENKKILYIR